MPAPSCVDCVHYVSWSEYGEFRSDCDGNVPAAPKEHINWLEENFEEYASGASGKWEDEAAPLCPYFSFKLRREEY